MFKGMLKVFDQTLAAVNPRIGTLNHPSDRNWNKARLSFGFLVSFGWFRSQLKPDFGHDLGINLLKRLNQVTRMIAMVKQNRNFGDVHGLVAKIIHILGQHFNQPLVIRNIRRGAMGKKGKAEGINRQMPFNPIGTLVTAKSL